MVIVRIRRRLRTSRFFRVNMKQAFPTSEWPWRPNLTSDLKFRAQIAHDVMFVLAV